MVRWSGVARTDRLRSFTHGVATLLKTVGPTKDTPPLSEISISHPSAWNVFLSGAPSPDTAPAAYAMPYKVPHRIDDDGS